MYEQLFHTQEEVFKVLANQKRLEVVQLLTHGELHVGEMVDMLGIPQSNVSQHLAVLRQAGILESRKQGKSIYYRLTDTRVAKACRLIREMLLDNELISPAGETILNSAKDQIYPLVQDPVCKMRMSPAELTLKQTAEGGDYYFCAAGCRDKFLAHPQKYLKPVRAI